MRRPSLVLVFALSACSADGPSAERRALPIVNGEVDTGDPAVVALIRSGASYCTGTVIAPRVVLTAAHCVDPGVTGFPPVGNGVFFGTNVQLDGDKRTIVDARIHPLWNFDTLANDIALLLMDDAAPAEPATMNTTPLGGATEGATVRIVGFGVTAFGAPDSGLKRTAQTTITGVTDVSFRYDTSPGQTCFGDSGGPGFLTIEGEELLAGVTSSGDPDCQAYGTDVRVDAYLDFVVQYLLDSGSCGADGFCLEVCGAGTDPDCSGGPCTACGNAQLGDPCDENLDCASNFCIGGIDDPAVRYCSRFCDDDMDCVGATLGTEPMDCTPVAGGEGDRVCTYDAPTPGGVGWECTDDGACRSGLCVASGDGEKRICSRECFAEGGADCPLGFACAEEVGGGGDAGPTRHVCLPAGPGAGWCAAAAPGTRAPAGALTVLLLLALVCIFRRDAATKTDRDPDRRR